MRSAQLDDYPRNEGPPSKHELHVDLWSWMARSAAIMSRVHAVVKGAHEEDPYAAALAEHRKHLDTFWNPQTRLYSDVTRFRPQGKHSYNNHVGYVNFFPTYGCYAFYYHPTSS